MNDLRELYQEVIVDHNRSPRNYGKLDCATCQAEGFNPLCGDQLTVYLHIDEGIIQNVSFEGKGCAISMASASLMTEFLKGKTEQEAEVWFERFHQSLTTDETPDTDNMGKLAVLTGVREYPMRVKCATLAWHAVHAALKGEIDPASTE